MWKFNNIPIVCVFFLLLVVSCDSGDIYPDEHTHDAGISIEASFRFTGTEAFPESYQILFGVFGVEKVEPILSKAILKPDEGGVVQVTISNIPESTTSVKLCLTTLGKQPIYTFYEMEVDNLNTDTEIPEQTINLLQYGRVQVQVFSSSCLSCHGNDGASAGLNLAAGKSHSNLVGKLANKSKDGKYRVTPSDVGTSFLIDVLEQGSLLRVDHTAIPAKYNDDLNLLKEWIKAGAASK